MSKTAIDIVCPRCLAAPGADCLPAGRTHQERFDAAVRANELTGLWRSAAAVAEERTAAIDPGSAAPLEDKC